MTNNEMVIYDKCLRLLDDNLDQAFCQVPITINSVVEIVTVCLASKINVDKNVVKENLLRRFDLTTYDLNLPLTRRIFNKSKRKYDREW